MKAMFLAMSSAGYGETLIGLSLARQLVPAGVESHFVIDTTAERLLRGGPFPYTVLDHNAGPLSRLLVDEAVEQVRPEVLVLSDYFTYAGVFSKRYRLDPWFIDSYQLPIMPIDIWEWEETDFSIDVFGEKKMPVSKRILDLGAYLRPVPICHPTAHGNPRAFPFRLWEGNERVSRRTREHLRTTFGLRPGDTMVLLAVAEWQQARFTEEAGNQSAARVPELMADYLAKLPEQTHFVLVGSIPPSLAALPPERTHVIPPCSPARFNVLLGSVDLVLTLNLAATTLARAVLSDTPGMALTNRFTVDEPADLAAVEAELGRLSPTVRQWVNRSLPVYPFRMWPLGFHSFLDPMLRDNPYPSAIASAELLDEAGALSTMEAVLYDPGTKERLAAARADYLRVLAGHPGTPEVFTEAAKSIGLVVV